MEIKWIFFDVGGVLTDESEYFNFRVDNDLAIINQYRPEVTRQDILDNWKKVSSVKGELDESILKLYLPDKAEVAIAEMWRRKKLGPNSTTSQVVRPGALETVRELSKKYKLGIIANQHGGIKEKLEKAGLLQYFQHTDVSDDYKLEKPDPEIFKVVMSGVGAEPAHSVIVDDNIERSLMPAKKLGLTTVWYKLEERSAPDRVIDFTISSLKDLLSIF
jgi:HAD superfamily hydrolase (TIGR01509 family)